MNDKQQIARLYEDMLRYTITKDTVSLSALLSDDSGLVNFGDPQFVKYLIENYG